MRTSEQQKKHLRYLKSNWTEETSFVAHAENISKETIRISIFVPGYWHVNVLHAETKLHNAQIKGQCLRTKPGRKSNQQKLRNQTTTTTIAMEYVLLENMVYCRLQGSINVLQ